MLIRLCTVCVAVAVVMSSSAYAKTTNQASGLDDAEAEMIEVLAPAAQAHRDEIHLTAFIDLLESVDQAQADYLVQNLAELSMDLYQPQQAYMLQEAILLAGEIDITIRVLGCTISCRIVW